MSVEAATPQAAAIKVSKGGIGGDRQEAGDGEGWREDPLMMGRGTEGKPRPAVRARGGGWARSLEMITQNNVQPQTGRALARSQQPRGVGVPPHSETWPTRCGAPGVGTQLARQPEAPLLPCALRALPAAYPPALANLGAEVWAPKGVSWREPADGWGARRSVGPRMGNPKSDFQGNDIRLVFQKGASVCTNE